MVPPLAMAIRLLPSRAMSVFATRSQVTRGRRSAKSSEANRPESRSRTFSKTDRLSSANGAAPRTAAWRASTLHGSIEVMATTCWASTSSGFRGWRVDSTCPSVIAWVSAAQATRSPRYLGKMIPVLGGVDPVPGATDPLDPAGHRRRGLDLDDQIDRPHVDAQLERRGGDQGRAPARP